MKRRAFWVLGIVLLVAVVTSALFAGWKCEIEGGKKGTVGKTNSLTIDMGSVVFSDVDSGATTNVAWPTTYDHYNGTVLAGNWTRQQIVTPSGNFVLKLSVKLSGRKSWGIWSSKRNAVTVDVRKGAGDGEIVATKTIDKSVGSPSTYTVELPQVTAGLSSGNSQQYSIMLRYDKWDGNSSNDNQCGSTITVMAD